MNASQESLPVDMRFAAALISMQMLATAAFAETLPEKMVSTLKDVYVAATSSEAMMAAGEKTAAAEGWKLLRSGPAPMLMMHNENGPKISFERAWQIDLSDGAQVSFYMSILRPEQPGVKYDACLVQPAKDVDSGDLAQAIERQFGATLTKATSGRYKEQESWFFVQEKTRGNCGRQIYFSLNQSSNRGQPKTLVFTDFAYPSDSKWGVLAKSISCPN